MSPRLLERLNAYLGDQLGHRPDGHPIFAWKNSDTLFWPAFATGRMVSKIIEVPIIGSLGTNQTVERVEIPVHEYKKDRQMRAENTWVVTKWLDPEALIWGWIGRHGGESRPSFHPSQEKLVEMWNERFPDAEFPVHGWRIPTDARLPSAPDGDRLPNWMDTRRFVALVKEQTRLSFDDRLQDMLEDTERQEAAVDKRVKDEILDDLPAFLNTTDKVGKRGGRISFPWSKKDAAN
jgi:hypothetical protein